MATSGATGAFTTANGQIIAADGTAFIARGIDVMEGNQPTASTLLNDFPGINFVRLAIYDYATPAALTTYVNSLTSQGIVVELEDHTNSTGSNAGGSSGTIFTGSQLSDELSWYASIATAFKSNPNVWFGTNNEPSETDAAGNQDPAALSTWQQQTYQAVRDTGNTSPVLLENYSAGPGKTNVGFAASAYASMTNVVWDVHYYGWLSGYSTDQTTVSATLSSITAETQAITGADGTIPVIIGEYGNSTNGVSVDANGDQVITAVQQSGLGSVAWAWGPGNPGDGLSDGGTALSAYGQQIAAGIAAAAAAASSSTATVPPSTVVTASANDTTITGTIGAITDANGHSWTITSGGQVAVNGVPDATTASVTRLAYADGKVWQENASNLWWDKSSPTDTWTAGTNPLPVPASANHAAITGTIGAITDATGHSWTITSGGQVAVNGVTDATTARVTQLAYVDGKVWQENASNLWWDKTSPTDTWAAGTNPLPAPTTIAASETSATISQSQMSVLVSGGGHMLFISGTDDTINLATGANKITDTGGGNNFVLAAARKGYDTFTSNVLAIDDTLDLRPALAATDWNGAASTLANYLTVSDSANGAVLSIAPTSGGSGVAMATISGATTATFSDLIAHALT